MGELVQLSCQSHVKSLCKKLWRFCHEQYKTDLMLCLNDDGYNFRLHHIILSAVSSKFKDFSPTSFIFDSIIKISPLDLNSIIEFVYLGKVKVKEECLPRLKAGAKALGIDSLIQLIDMHNNKRSRMRKSYKRKLGKAMTKFCHENSNHTQKSETKELLKQDEVRKTPDWDEVSSNAMEHSSQVDSNISKCLSNKTVNTNKKRVVDSESSSEVAKSKKKRGRHRLPYPFDEVRNQYVCSTCDKGFKRRDNYCRHVRTHDETAMFAVHKCSQCQFKTTNWTTWKSHLAALHHMDPDGNLLAKNIKCPQCDFTCVSMFQLKNHHYFKHATKKFTCDECGYSCMRKSEMELHMRGGKHQSDRPYIDRPFPCHLCQFASWRRHSLKIHYQHVHKVVFNNNDEFVSWYVQLRSTRQVMEP
ncbi:hypothetical protein CHUAL_007176 [Chamberlinius hualienensis]